MLSIPPDKAITIWHSNDMCIRQQGKMWYDVQTYLQMLPCAEFALVAITHRDIGLGEAQPIFSYLIYRPAAVVLSFDHRVQYVLSPVPSVQLQAWYKRGRPWTTIGSLKRNRAQHSVTR